jgi:hypothetical protein
MDVSPPCRLLASGFYVLRRVVKTETARMNACTVHRAHRDSVSPEGLTGTRLQRDHVIDIGAGVATFFLVPAFHRSPDIKRDVIFLMHGFAVPSFAWSQSGRAGIRCVLELDRDVRSTSSG